MNTSAVKSWYQSLGVWGSLGTIVAGIAGILHLATSPGLEQGLNTWSAAAGVVITGLISLYGRIRATRQIVATPSTPAATKMLFLCFALGAVAGLSGCAASVPSTGAATQPVVAPPPPTAQQTAITNVDTAINTYRAALNLIQDAETAKLIPQKDVAAVNDVLNAIAASLAAASADAQAGNVSAAQTDLDEVTAALPQIAPLLAEVNQAKKQAATKPSS